MYRPFLMIISLLLCGYICQGQKREGVVRDSTSGEALPFATISIKSVEGRILTGTLTDEKGQFAVTIPESAAIMEIGHIGYQTMTIEGPFTSGKLRNILLKQDQMQLDEVVISGERTTREFLIDRKVINFGAELQTAGGTVLEAFEQLPEVETNRITGDVLLRGSSNVRILVNGKPSPLNNQDLLAQINAAQVQKVEIITAPSAKYQADGLAGIINIVLKDKVIKGISGNGTLDARTNPGYAGSINLTSGFKAFNIQGSISHRNNYFLNKDYAHRKVLTLGETQSIYSESEFDGHVNSLRLKADWFIDPLNDLSFAAELTNNEHDINILTSITDQHGLRENRLHNFHLHNTAVYNFNYRKRFSEEGASYLDLNLNLNRNNNQLPSIIRESGILTIDNDIRFNNEIANAAVDLVTKLGQYSLEVGGMYTFKSIDNKQTAIVDEQSVLATYQYDEHTAAGYLVVKRPLGKTSIQAGLRGELFRSDGEASMLTEVIDRAFFNLFPSLHLKYQFSDKVVYTIAHNRRITRPGFYEINPITTINDPLFRRIGNPNLTPEFTDNVELGMNYNGNKLSINASAYYRYMSSIINRIFTINEAGMTVMSFKNGGESHTVGFESTLSKDLTSKLSLAVTGNAYYQNAQPDLDDFFYEDQYGYNLRTKLGYQWNKKLSVDMQWLYFGQQRGLNTKGDARNFTNLAIRYKVLKEKGSINLRITDMFKGNIYENERFSRQVTEDRKWLGQTRIVMLSLLYNFSQGDIRKRKAQLKNFNESGVLE